MRLCGYVHARMRSLMCLCVSVCLCVWRRAWLSVTTVEPCDRLMKVCLQFNKHCLALVRATGVSLSAGKDCTEPGVEMRDQASLSGLQPGLNTPIRERIHQIPLLPQISPHFHHASLQPPLTPSLFIQGGCCSYTVGGPQAVKDVCSMGLWERV